MKLSQKQLDMMQMHIDNSNDHLYDLEKCYEKWKNAYDEAFRVTTTLYEDPDEMGLETFEINY